jgi:putative zinc finger protein
MALADRHPDVERLAEYADGVLPAEAREAVEEHLVECADCRFIVAETTAFGQGGAGPARTVSWPRTVPFRGRWWVRATAAVLVTAAVTMLVVRIARVARPDRAGGRSARPELQELIAALAQEPTRPVEGRLTGGFAYGPPPTVVRGPGERDASPEVRIAAANLQRAARGAGSARSLAAAGVADLVLGQMDAAIDSLEGAIARNRTAASAYSDLAAAYLARAAARGGADDSSKALAAADRALDLAPALPEALFNRALALEYLHRDAEADRAWARYRAQEPDARWRDDPATRRR